MAQPDVASPSYIGKQILSLEAKTIRRLRTTARATINIVGPGNDEALVGAALLGQMTKAVGDARAVIRIAAAKQLAAATGLDITPSGANDNAAATRAGASYARAWQSNVARGGASGGGGSTDDWEDARRATDPKIARIAAWEVVHAWNDEHRRNVAALPQYDFVQVWCAILDKFLCPRCRAMNGKRTNALGEFPGGWQAWPPAHPDCRCFVMIAVA